MTETPVSTVVDQNFCQVPTNASVQDALSAMREAKSTEAYVTDKGMKFHGKLTLHALMLEDPSKKVSPYADQSPISIKHDASLQQAIEVASSFVGESIPVINRSNWELLGIVTEADLFQLYLSLQHRVADLERT